MLLHDSAQQEIPWHAVLNCPEARVLSRNEERELLVELADCKTRILAARPACSAKLDRPATELDFQQLVRELSSSPQGLDRRADTLRGVAERYQELRSKLALANVRLVAHVAKRYQGRGISPADLIQEGMCALLVAIDRFEIANESRLATYAIWWIRQAIQRAIAGGAYPVRLNPRQLLRLAQLTDTEVARKAPAADMTKRTRVDAPGAAVSQALEHLRAVTRPTLSLDSPSSLDGVTPMVEFCVPSIDLETENTDRDESVGLLIQNLDPREQLVLTLRFGLKGSAQQTLVQVSKVLGVSKERVRQIEARALRKLRERSPARP
jgi:RNA polymerase primary sigma factor